MYITKVLILVILTALASYFTQSSLAQQPQKYKKPASQHQGKQKSNISFDSICIHMEELGLMKDSLSEQIENISYAKKRYQESQLKLIQVKADLISLSAEKQKKMIDSSINYNFLDVLLKEKDKESRYIQTRLDSLSHEQNTYNTNVYLPKLKKTKGAFKLKNKKGQGYRIFIVDTTSNTVSMLWKNKKGIIYTSLGAAVQDFTKSKVLMATNGGMFNQGEVPKGLYIEDGKVVQNLDTLNPVNNQMANFYLMPNGIFYIDNKGQTHIDSTQAFKNNVPVKTIRYATQSGPMLITNGTINAHFKKGSKNLNIRSGVGISADGRTIFVISDTPVNFYDFATFFKYNFGCKNALYLDGAISKMYLSEISPKELGGNFGVIITVSKR